MAVVKQLAYLYDSTGLIEKHNRIYFNPFNVTTATQWFSAFDNKAGKNNSYYGIELTGWSPEDRVLKVKGQIDDFRDYVTGALILNYLIVKRLDENNNVKAYVSFFVESVRQAGVGSVELSLTPDHFTNTFFFNVQGADPFNQTIKNAYVERQHYDRVKYEEVLHSESYSSVSEIETNKKYYLRNFTVTVLPRTMNDVFIENSLYDIEVYDRNHLIYSGSARYLYFNYVRPSQSPQFGVNGTIVVATGLIPSSGQVLWAGQTTGRTFVKLKIRGNTTGIASTEDNDFKISQFFKGYYTNELVYDNLELFANTEEKFNFRYQFKDKKQPFCVDDNIIKFTDSELEEIENSSSIADLSSNTREKVIKSSIYWYIIQCRKSLPLPYRIKQVGQPESTYATISSHFGKLTKDISTNICYLTLPFIKTNSITAKYENELKNRVYFTSKPYVYNKFGSVLYQCDHSYADEFGLTFNDERSRETIGALTALLGGYIQSIFIIKDINCQQLYSEVSSNPVTYRIEFDSAMLLGDTNAYFSFKDVNISQTLIPALLTANEETISHYLSVSGFYPDADYSYPAYDIASDRIRYIAGGTLPNYLPIYVLNAQKIKELNLEISEEIPNVKNIYYDTLLTFEPYSFYSISTSQLNESVLYKSKYYQSYNNHSFNIDLQYTYSLTVGLKVAYVVNYNVNGYKTPYYNDSLILDLSSTLPFASESYFNFLYQNMALMKNQYALAERNAWEDLGQRFFNTAPNQVGKAATRMGWVGAVAETGSQLSGMVDDMIDLGQNLRNIEDTQKAQKAGAGAKPNVLKQSATDLIFEANVNEICCYLNHYDIDTLSKNSICKYLERYGYQVDLFDTLNIDNRKGWNYIKLIAFDIEKPVSIEQENDIRTIFKSGVTLLHNPEYLRDDSYHNYEVSLDE